MARDLMVHGAGWTVGVGQPLTVMVDIVSKDLKGRPVHTVPITRAEALKLARQLIASVEYVDEQTGGVS